MTISLHLGAHRTGTTALQRLLQRHVDRLATAGIGFLGPQTLRRADLTADRRAWTQARAAGQPVACAPLAAECARLTAAGCNHIVISEENLVGTMGVNLARAELYPNAQVRLADLATALPAAPARIFLTVRDFAGYWRSALAHALLAGGATAFDAERFSRSRGNAWTPLLRAIRSAFPDSRLLVARHTVHRDFIPALAAEIIGPDTLAGVSRPWTTVNAALPADAIEMLRAMPEGPERTRLAEAVRREGRAPIDPFSPAQRAVLEARFAREWAALVSGAEPGVEIMTLVKTESTG
ncbi:MAG: hypothetical protein ACK4NE_06160 [Albidovulum sp.]